MNIRWLAYACTAIAISVRAAVQIVSGAVSQLMISRDDTMSNAVSVTQLTALIASDSPSMV